MICALPDGSFTSDQFLYFVPELADLLEPAWHFPNSSVAEFDQLPESVDRIDVSGAANPIGPEAINYP